MKALLFDLDGLIIRAWPFLERFNREFLEVRGLGLSQPDLLRVFNGHGVDGSFERFSKHHAKEGRALIEGFKQAASEAYQEIAVKYEVVEGMGRVISELHCSGVPMAIASNSSSAKVRRKLEAIGLMQYFEGRAFSYEHAGGKQKPDPALLLHAAEQLSVDIRDCVLVGDSAADVCAARAAKCDSYILTADYAKVSGIQAIEQGLRDAGAKCVLRTPPQQLRDLVCLSV